MLTLYHDSKQYPLENSEYYIRQLANGLDEVIFSIDIYDPIYALIAEEENIVDRGGQTYKVKQIDAGSVSAKVVCRLDIDAWKATLNVNYNSGSKTCYDQIAAVKPTGWTILDRAHVNISRTLEGDLTPYDVCVECTNVYNVYIRWDNKRKECTIYPKAMSAPVGAFATRELNLKEINYKGKSNDLVTRLYAYGKDNLSFASINGGKAYIDNNTYESRVICGIWRDERYEVKQNLLDDATAKLEKMSRPERTYECSIVDLQATNPELYNNLDFSLFTTATLIDDVKNTSVDYQVVERHVYPYHPEENEVIFNSEPLKITASVVDIKYQIENPNSTFQQIMDKKAAEATDWMLSGNGYVVAIQSSDGQWKELLFMDTNDISTAQKVLRINENGIGFSTTGAQGPYTNAWTINGQLVADFITTGHMLLDRLQGGTAIIGGKANGTYANGTLIVKDANDNDIASISNLGITFNSNNFKVDKDGKLTAKSASIYGALHVGGQNNGDGSFTVKDNNGNTICTINNSGITFNSTNFSVNNQGKLTCKSATIEGSITVGGNNNTSGSISVKDGSGNIVCTIDNTGIHYGNNKFKVDANGKLTATGADIKGAITVGGNNNTDGTITIENSSGNVICTIDKSGIVFGNNAFKVDADGNLTATGVDLTGDIKATSGQIGSSSNAGSRWQIGDKSIYNGVTGMSDNYHSGIYIGTDGIRVRGNTGITLDILLGGAIVSNSSIQAHGIQAVSTGGNAGFITSDGDITAGNNISATGDMTAGGYKTNESGTIYTGATQNISWGGTEGNGHALVIKNGLIVGAT